MTSKGFLANYTTSCGATITTSGSGDLMSPNYPHAWESGGDCTWTIVGSTQSTSLFYFIFKFLHVKRIKFAESFAVIFPIFGLLEVQYLLA